MVIGMSMAILFSYLAWVCFVNDLYAEKFGIKWILYFLTFLMIFLQYNFVRCYASDPGIIQKNLVLNKQQDTIIDIKTNNSKPKQIKNAYNFLASSINHSKDMNIDLENNISNINIKLHLLNFL